MVRVRCGQVPVTLSIANHRASLAIAHQLYLPKDWSTDAARRRQAHVPKTVRFMTKPQIALVQRKRPSDRTALMA